MSKIYNLENQYFGNLHIIHKAPKDKIKKKNCTRWICECKCGNITTVTTSNLINGRITQCRECALKDVGLKKRKNLIGTKIGKLTVVKMIYPDRTIDPNGETKVLCRCDCGNEVIRTTSSILLSKKTQANASCGCNKSADSSPSYKSMINKKYGRLLILEELWDGNNPKVKCRCDCDKEILLSRSDVLSGHTQSCGCLQKERASQARKKDETGFISESGIKILYPTTKNKNNQQLWMCECFCGNKFEELPARIKNNHVQSCGCIKKSIKEKIITDFLLGKSVDFISEYTYNDCKNKYVLRFDFAILNKDKSVKSLIEYDGEQHFKPVDYFGGEDGYRQTVYRDEIKNQYCKNNNIPLLRLPYYLSNDEIKEKILNII